jgi:vancomycin resistance protein VanJ
VAQILRGNLSFFAELGSNFMPPALLVGFPLLLLSLLLRLRLQVILLLPGIVYFLIHYSALLLPGTAAAAPEARQIRILTYNLHGATSGFEPIINIIDAADADIVALQELTEFAEARFATEFTDVYPHQVTFALGASVVGQGILSRYPLSDVDYWESGLGNIRARVALDDAAMTLYNLHPPPPAVRAGLNASGRNTALDQLLDRLVDEDGSFILAGDFNMTDQAGDYARLTQTAGVNDAFREAGVGLGPTFPDMGYAASFLRYLPPLFRIDYVFYTAPFRAIEARVWQTSGGSDHYPVLATLAME